VKRTVCLTYLILKIIRKQSDCCPVAGLLFNDTVSSDLSHAGIFF
jgi:hypothetical protein